MGRRFFDCDFGFGFFILVGCFGFLLFSVCLYCFFEGQVNNNRKKNFVTGSVLASWLDLPDSWVEGHHIL